MVIFKCAVEQVAYRGGKICVVPFNETCLGEIGILAGGDIAHQIIPKRVGAVFLNQYKWINNVAGAFAHLRPAKIPPAVNEQLRHLIVGKSDRMQHDEPVDAVRWNEYVFADDLERRPFVAES